MKTRNQFLRLKKKKLGPLEEEKRERMKKPDVDFFSVMKTEHYFVIF